MAWGVEAEDEDEEDEEVISGVDGRGQMVWELLVMAVTD